MAVTVLQQEGMDALKTQYPWVYVKYPGGFEKMRVQERRLWKPDVIWIWGPTGTGKTRHVFEEEKENLSDLWVSSLNLKWFLGYDAQSVTLFDDFREEMCPLFALLRLLDRYPIDVEVKGGHRSLVAKKMYITSNKPPEDVYKAAGEDIRQLRRRITTVLHFEIPVPNGLELLANLVESDMNMLHGSTQDSTNAEGEMESPV